ncbi:Predicted nucleic-acid-binding protein containing a Zn-ribbon [Pseudomonas aeruginosa]|nr:Predicted nucleic-acid-binding protein containing a Zn-ribbon [Pseudomonas aeruginosa]
MLSYTLNYQPWNSELEVPYVIAIIELAEQEGLRFLSNVVDLDPLQVHIGMPVRVRFLNVEDVWLPLFEKDQ